MFEDLIRRLQASQGGNAISGMFGAPPTSGWDALEGQFGKQVDMLPPAPSGDFFQVPANSPDPQAGQLIPLSGGQPTGLFDMANRRDAFGATGPAGVFPPDMAPNISLGSQSMPVPRDTSSTGGQDIASFLANQSSRAPSPIGSPTGSPAAALAAAAASQPAGPMAMNADGQPFIRQSDSSQIPASDTGLKSWLQSQGRSLAPTGVESSGGAPQFMTMPAGNRMPVGSPQQEAAANWTYALQMSNGDPRAMAAILGQIEGSSNDQFRAQQSALGRTNQLDIQKLANSGHLDAARVQANAHQMSALDTEELKIRDGVGRGMIDKLTGQALMDTINQRRQALSANIGAVGAPAGAGQPGAGAIQSPSIAANADVSALRGLFGNVDQGTGRFTPNPSVSGQSITQMIDKLDPAQIPAIATAIRGGTFGDPMAVRNAALNSLGQNYLMSQGRLPGGEGQAPGMYTIPYGQDNKPLMSLMASSPNNIIDSTAKKAAFAQNGVPYDTIVLPDGTKVPFDPSGVQGLSNMSATLGYNQQQPKIAPQRLSALAQLASLLQSTAPPGR